MTAAGCWHQLISWWLIFTVLNWRWWRSHAQQKTALHEQLTADPFAEVTEDQLAALADSDVAHNYRAVLAFRQFIAQHDTLQSAYMAIARGAPISFPPLFVDQLAQIILREILTEVIDPMQIRAAEMLFRSQSVTTEDGRIMIADRSVVSVRPIISAACNRQNVLKKCR